MAESTTLCGVWGLPAEGFAALAGHFVAEAARSDIAHVMWLNRRVTKHRVAPDELAVLLRRQAEGRDTGADRVIR